MTAKGTKNTKDDPPGPVADLTAQWKDATDKTRLAMAWVIGAFAAVGAALVGTAPLALLDDVQQWSGRQIVIGLALGAVVLAAVVIAIWKASNVMMPSITTLAKVEHAAGHLNTELRDEVLGGEDGLLSNWNGSIASLRAGRTAWLQTLKELRDDGAAADDPDVLATLANLAQIKTLSDATLAAGSYVKTRQSADDSRVWIVGCAIAVGVGVIGLAVIAGVNKGASTSAASEPVAGQSASFVLTAAGVAKFGDLLDPKCATNGFPGLVFSGGTTGPWDAVSLGGNGCNIARFQLAASEGQPVYTSARKAVLTLTGSGRTKYTAVLGTGCVTAPIDVIRISNASQAPWEVVVTTSTCAATRLTITKADGTVVDS